MLAQNWEPPLIDTMDAFWTAAGAVSANTSTEIDLELDVLYHDPHWNLMWVADASGIHYVQDSNRFSSGNYNGQRLRLQGEITPADGFGGSEMQVEKIGPHAYTGTIDLTDPQKQLRSSHVVYATVRGYVYHQTMINDYHYGLRMSSNGFAFFARGYIEPDDPIPYLHDAIVELEVIVVPHRSPDGQLRDAALWIPSIENIRFLNWIDEDPRFDNRDGTPIEELYRMPVDERVKVVGWLHEAEPGNHVTVRDSTGQVDVLSLQRTQLRPGEPVEAIGYPRQEGGRWTLFDAVFRPVPDSETAQTISAQRQRMSVLRHSELVRMLPRSDANRGYPVRLQGIVTWSHPNANYIYIQDATGGIRVQLPPRLPVPDLGRTLNVRGQTLAGGFIPEVRAEEIDLLGYNALPAAQNLALTQAMTGMQEAEWVEMSGYVRSAEPGGPGVRLELATASGFFEAIVGLAEFETPESIIALQGSVIRLWGVNTARHNERGQLTGIRLLVPGVDQIETIEKRPGEPFSIDETPISELHQYNLLVGDNRFIRVQGIVTLHMRGIGIVIQSGDDSLMAFSSGTEKLEPGDLVEVVGLPGRRGNRILLREAIYRRTGQGVEPDTTALSAPISIDPELDLTLVSLEGTVLDGARVASQMTALTIQAEGQTFEALLSWPESDPEDWSSGSQLRLTGVYDLLLDSNLLPRNFQLIIRSSDDIEILTLPSWWTPNRIASLAGILGVFGLGSLAWILSLRRQVSLQTSELKRYYERQIQLQSRYRNIVDNASDAIFTFDMRGQITSLNPAAERLTGYRNSEAIGKVDLHELLVKESGETETKNLLPENHPVEGVFAFRGQIINRSGDQVWIESRSRLLLEGGEKVGVLSVVRDISRTKEIEQQLQKARTDAEALARSKSSFLANMSHEIRTPMNGVIGMSNFLLDTQLNNEQRDFTETIRDSAEALLTVLNDILDFSKIEAGKLQFEHAPFSLRETIEGTLALLAPRAHAKLLEIGAFLPHDLPSTLLGDPGRIRQILMNLLGNAIKFTSKGNVTLSLDFEPVGEDQLRLCFEISDTGIGIEKTAMKQLFTPFNQADSSTTRKYGGTGLGLAICKQIVELMDGRIGVRSRPGMGSTFWFEIVLDRDPDERPDGQILKIHRLKGTKVLGIDDHPVGRSILEHYAEACSMHMVTADSADAALHHLHEASRNGEPFELILLDYQMPHKDGLSLALELQADQNFNTIPKILLTSLDRRLTEPEMKSHGIDSSLLKPLRQQEFLNTVHRSLFKEVLQSKKGPDGAGIDAESRNLNILVAEDSPVNQRVAMIQLQKLGHKVVIAKNGREAIEAVENDEFDAILMDCNMPELDGFEATRILREDPIHNAIYIVAMTANVMQGDRERCIDAGMNDYVGKPTRIEELKAALRPLTDSLNKTHGPDG